MSHFKSHKLFGGILSRPIPNLPAKFLEEDLEGELSPRSTRPALQFASEVNLFVTSEKKQELER